MDTALTKALRNFLLADSAVATASSNKIYSNRFPQTEKSGGILYQRISEITDYHMNGQSSIVRVRMQITCWSPKMENSVDMADKVKARLSGFKGYWPYGSNSPQDTVEILGVFAVNHRDLYDSTVQFSGMSRDFEILYQEN